MEYQYIFKITYLPSLWNHPQLALHHLAGCTGEVEIHKPLLEKGLGDGFERGVGLAVEFDFFVQRGEDVRDAALGGKGRHFD